MKVRRTLLGPTVVLPLLFGLTYGSGAPQTVLASQGSDGCNPGRSGSTAQDNFDGWLTVGQGNLGGATVKANTYSPYVENYGTQGIAGKDDTTAWALLGNTAHELDLAQVGYGESYNNTGGGNGTTGSERVFFVEYSNSGTPVIDQVTPAPSTGLPSQPYLEDQYIYNTLYGNVANSFTFQIGAPGVSAANVYYDGSALAAQNLGWVPNEANIAAEVHTLDDQMPGDIANHLELGSAGFYSTSLGSWEAIDQGATDTQTGPVSNDFDSTNEYAYQETSTNTLYVWDIGCPNSVTSSPINAGNVVDSAGTGSSKTVSSNTPNQTNGPYSLISQASDGNLVLYDNRGYALWSPGQAALSSYLLLQTGDNLVLYNGVGGTVLWSSGTGGDGYGSPYAVVQSDGNYVLYGNSSNALWDTGTSWDSTNSGLLYGQDINEGTTISSHSGNYHLALQTDGNLVLYNSSWSPVWDTGTSGDGSAVNLYMQADGNLVLYRYAGPSDALWSSGTGGDGTTSHMVVNDGSFSVSDVTGYTHYTS